MNLIERSGYTVFDLLSDVGGLQAILISGISFILSIFNYNFLENYLVNKLFKSKAVSLMTTQSEMIKEFCLGNYLLSKLACCCEKSRKFQVMKKSREALLKEADIIRLVRSRRFVHLALKHLLDPDVRKELKSQCQFREVDIQNASSSLVNKSLHGSNKVLPHDVSIDATALSATVSDCQMDALKDSCQIEEIDEVPQ